MTEAKKNLDDIETNMGAIQYVKCSHCGIGPGLPCRVNYASPSSFIPDFAHVARRMEYDADRIIYGKPSRRPILAEDGLPAIPHFRKEAEAANSIDDVLGLDRHWAKVKMDPNDITDLFG